MGLSSGHKWASGIIAVAMLFAGLALIGRQTTRQQEDSWQDTPPPRLRLTPNQECRIMAERLISKTLKAPSTAKFAPHVEWEFKKINDRVTRVNAWVDAQNTYGVPLRSYFEADLSHTGELWKVTYLHFEGSDDDFGAPTLSNDQKAANVDHDLVESEKEVRRRANKAKMEAAEDALVKQQQEQILAKQKQQQADDAAKTGIDPKILADDRARAEQQRTPEGLARAKEREAQREWKAKADQQRKLRDALTHSQYRAWIFLGGRDASAARIIDYVDGELTLAKRDGKQEKVRVSRLGKADRAFVDQWISDNDL